MKKTNFNLSRLPVFPKLKFLGLKLININLDLYSKIYLNISLKNKQSTYVKELNEYLKLLKEKLIESNLENILLEKIKETGNSDKFLTIIDENVEVRIVKIISLGDKIMNFILNYIEPKGFKNYFINYFFNDTFGSIFEMNHRLSKEFKSKEDFIDSHDKYKLET